MLVQMSESMRWPKRLYPLVDGRGTVPLRDKGGPRLGAVVIRVFASWVFPRRQPRHSAASKWKLRKSTPSITMSDALIRRSLQWPSEQCTSTGEGVRDDRPTLAISGRRYV